MTFDPLVTMSFFSTPIAPSASAVTSTPPVAAPKRAAASAAAPADDAASVSVDTTPSSPPTDVLHALGVAAAAFDRLAQSGRRLSFSVDPPTGRVSVQVTDTSGTVLRTISGAEALRVASGEPLA